MAALKVLKQVARIADFDFVAFEVLPILWTFALGPLLDLTQFQAFMDLIKAVSTKIEREQSQKLRDTKNTSDSRPAGSTYMAAQNNATTSSTANGQSFANLVTGRSAASSSDMISDWDVSPIHPRSQALTPAMSNMASPIGGNMSRNTSTGLLSALPLRSNESRPITPDQGLNAFATLQPQTMFNNPLQPTPAGKGHLMSSSQVMQPVQAQQSRLQAHAPVGASSFAIAPPPQLNSRSMNGGSMSSMVTPGMGAQSKATLGQGFQVSQSEQSKTGLDKFESLI